MKSLQNAADNTIIIAVICFMAYLLTYFVTILILVIEGFMPLVEYALFWIFLLTFLPILVILLAVLLVGILFKIIEYIDNKEKEQGLSSELTGGKNDER